LEKLEWLPLFIDRLLSSPAWQDMEDYQRGWYIQLLLRCTRSERLGYLRLDGQLWRVAGARTAQFWNNQNAAVMACFKIRQFDGQDWLYNSPLLKVMEKQSTKYRRRNTDKDGLSVSPDSDVKNLGKTVSKFIKPTLAEIKAYCEFRGNNIDPVAFFDYQESTGWMVGKKKMSNWQAAIRTWEKRQKKDSEVDSQGKCSQHPNSGLTQWGTCWDCYVEKHGTGSAASA